MSNQAKLSVASLAASLLILWLMAINFGWLS